jgi:hypothetical protein
MNCKHCGKPVPAEKRECQSCGTDNGYPNVRIAESPAETSALDARLTEQLVGPISQILLMHSSAELGNPKLASKAMAAVNDNEPPSIIQLRDVLAARYRLTEKRFDRDDKWILDQELEVLLQAA